MSFKSAYLQKVYDKVSSRNPGETEFLNAILEVLESLEPVVAKNPGLEKTGVIERLVEPERFIQFRVSWVDDAGNVQVNRGFRVQFNSSIGPYKGGLRFHPTVNASVVKFLGFEQIFKNSLTTLPIGGGKGGSDFDPKGKSDAEVMRFCQAFMSELYRHIGPDKDVPAGDIGVGGREIGFLFGQYKRIRGNYENGVLTGKGMSFGGSFFRPEATGYGAVYFLQEMLKYKGDTMAGKTVAVSGYGNVAWGTILKCNELGAKCVTISGSKGYVYDEAGITNDKVEFLLKMRAEGATLEEYANLYGAKYYPGERPWGVKCDIAIPSATQNELNLEEAKTLTANGCKYIVEAANMPCTLDATRYFLDNGVFFAPGKAANAGGVAVSALEMSQNSERLCWKPEEVDAKLKEIMQSIFNAAISASKEYDCGDNLIIGANIAGFTKVADAMLAYGII